METVKSVIEILEEKTDLSLSESIKVKDIIIPLITGEGIEGANHDFDMGFSCDCDGGFIYEEKEKVKVEDIIIPLITGEGIDGANHDFDMGWSCDCDGGFIYEEKVTEKVKHPGEVKK